MTMKRMLVFVLSLALLLAAASAAAETAEKTEMGILKVNEAFSIRSRIPDGYSFIPVTSKEMNLIGILAGGDDRPMITMTIAYSRTFADVGRFNDVDEETVEQIRQSFLERNDVSFEDLKTAYDTRLLKITGNDRSFAEIFTVYKGYELEFVLVGKGELTDADVQMLVDFISDMDFVPAD